MKRLATLLFITLSQACTPGQSTESSQDGEIKIEGRINHPTAGEPVILEKIGQNDVLPVDTLTVSEDSTFQYYLGEIEPGFYRINFYGKQYVNLILDDENVQVTADGDRPDGEALVEGSTDTDYFNEINDLMRDMQQQINGLNADYMKARADDNTDKMGEIEERYRAIEEENNEAIKQKIEQMGTSLATFYAINFLDAEKEFPFLKSLADKFQQELPDSRYTQQFVSQVEDLSKLAIGMEAPDIALPNPEGDTVALSSLRGQYVMIDFWASWCKPCRMENPNVVRLYDQYKDQGFEIYGVSLDRTKDAWVEAIEDDNLEWKQVSDLQYFDSEAAAKYNVNAIPATVLIDKEGKIIAKNLRGQALKEKLAELFGGA